MSSSTFKILFYVRKNYVNKNGKTGIMIRITLNGEISQFSSKLDVDPGQWDVKAGKLKGRSIQAAQFNALLDNIRASLVNHSSSIILGINKVNSVKSPSMLFTYIFPSCASIT